MPKEIEAIILSSLMTNPDFAEQVLPHMEDSYFGNGAKPLFKIIRTHIDRYGKGPTQEQIVVELDALGLAEHQHDGALDRLKDLASACGSYDLKWLLPHAEKFIERQRRHNFMLDSIKKLEDGKVMPSPDEYAKAITFSFSDTNQQGFDFFKDGRLLHDFMNSQNERFSFDLAELNRLTNGGVSRKTLNVILAPTSVGKSLMLCHLAACYVRQGRKVLYITLEMSEKVTAQRITANLLDRGMDALAMMPPVDFESAIADLQDRCSGGLIIREFPASSVSVTNFRSLMSDLKRRRSFVPDIVMVDYLNLCRASSLPKSAQSDLYQRVGAIAQELRGFATEHNAVVWTATQTNRSGFKAPELEMEHTSDSNVVNCSADLILGLAKDDKVPDTRTIKVLKNRNEGISGSPKAVIGVNASRMKMYDIDGEARVKTALTDMQKEKRSLGAAKVNSRRPKFAIDAEELAEAV